MPLSATEFTKAMLARLMWQEDNEDGLQGMTAVGLVIRNRVVAGWNGGDWLDVMRLHYRNTSEMEVFSGAWTDPRDPKFQAVLAKAESIYGGTEEDITGGALYYADLTTVSDWFRENIVHSPDHPRIGTVGRRTFFA